MKTLLRQVCICVLVVLCVACKNTNAPSNEGEPSVDDRIAIIKLTPEMEEYVFAAPVVDSVVSKKLYYGDELVLYNHSEEDSLLTDFAQSYLSLVGTSPYILLEDGWAIVNWRWQYWHPLSGEFRATRYGVGYIDDYSTNPAYYNGSLQNEEYYLLPIRWEELTDLYACWNITNGNPISKPEVRYVSRKDIENYGGSHIAWKEIEQTYPIHFQGLLFSMYRLYNQDATQFQNCVKDIDSIQDLYVETLNQMIKNNYFE